MASFPNRCQHLKINGTQCGSPALRRNRFCFFHKRFQDHRIQLHADRVRRGVASFVLPVLEDANSIQVALMQVMRLLVSNQIEHKTASLLLYALQTASTNLRHTNFNPRRHEVVLDPRDAADTLLGEDIWDDDDFEEEELTEEEEAEIEREEQQEAEERKREDRAKTDRWVEELGHHYAEEGMRQNLRQAVAKARLEHAQKEIAERQALQQAARHAMMTADKAGAPPLLSRSVRQGGDSSTAAEQNEALKPAASQAEKPNSEEKPASEMTPEEVRAQLADLIRKRLVPRIAGKFPPASVQSQGGPDTEKKVP